MVSSHTCCLIHLAQVRSVTQTRTIPFWLHSSPLVDTAHVAATRVDTAELVPHWSVSTMKMHLISPRHMWRAAQHFAVTQRKYME